jgi:hypothetical protein
LETPKTKWKHPTYPLTTTPPTPPLLQSFPPNRNPSQAPVIPAVPRPPDDAPPSSHRLRIHTSTAIPVALMPLEDGRSKNMSRSRNYPYAMTLRLSSPMQCEVENLAYDSRLSMAQFIRRALRRAIADAYEHGTQNTHLQAEGGAL